MSNSSYTFPLSALVEVISRFDLKLDTNEINIVGSNIYFSQTTENFRISYPVAITKGNLHSTARFSYTIANLNRWVADAMKHSASNFSPLRMMVTLETDYRSVHSLNLDSGLISPLRIRNQDMTGVPVPFIPWDAVTEIGNDPLVLPMGKIMPYLRFNRHVYHPLPMSVFGIDGFPEWNGFAIDRMIGSFRKGTHE